MVVVFCLRARACVSVCVCVCVCVFKECTNYIFNVCPAPILLIIHNLDWKDLTAIEM
jgi:hypothetical protein